MERRAIVATTTAAYIMVRMRLLALALALLPAIALAGAPSAVPTFHSIGLYWSPEGGAESNAARVEFRKRGTSEWRRGLDLWFDSRNSEYRGSLVELDPGSPYEVKLTLSGGLTETMTVRTWDERFPVKRTVEIAPGTTLVIGAQDSGDEKGYVLFTARPGRNVIEGGGEEEACVLVKQGAHHVIIRGLVLRNCRRYGVLIERQSERQSRPPLDAHTHDIVIEANEISGWGGFENLKPGSGDADSDGAIHCDYYHESDDAKRPDRIIVQGNRIRDPRHGANAWHSATHGRRHPYGPLGVAFGRCGRNHVIRYNNITSQNGNHYKDGLGGGENMSAAGFPWADSDIYANRISHVYDDAISAEGANRNVRIWANYLERVFVPIANAPTSIGPLYVWRNVSHRTKGMYDPGGERGRRGPFIKAGSRHAEYNGGRAYYFHNSALEDTRGIVDSGGRLYNYVSRNNVFDRKTLAGPAQRIANFNDRYPRPEAGAHQSGEPPARYGVEAYRAALSAH